jgi:hypothetical protein
MCAERTVRREICASVDSQELTLTDNGCPASHLSIQSPPRVADQVMTALLAPEAKEFPRARGRVLPSSSQLA